MARPKVNPDYIQKTCEYCNSEYKVSFHKRKTSRYCNKKCANSDVKVLDKIRQSQRKTYDEKYNGLHPMQTEDVKKNFKKSILSKYGVESYSKLDEYKDKVKNTCIEKYGVESYSKTNEYKKRVKKTCIKKYGVNNPMKCDTIKNKVKNTCIEKYGVDWYSKSKISTIHHNDLTYTKILKFENVTPLFNRDEFFGVTKNIYYKFKCDRCGSVISLDLNDGKKPLCVNCDKLNTSFIQKEIYEFLSKYSTEKIQLNDRTSIKPNEIDISIPSLKLGIEYNSLYYHSELTGGRNKFYHLRKTKISLLRGIFLIHIFENEWNEKKHIVKSILRNKINSFDEKIFARKCEIKEIDAQTSYNFLIRNHIQGKDNASIRIGLFYQNELVSVMTFIKSRYDKNLQYEMSRFCNKLNCKIVGGASKLFKYFIKNYNPQTICSYSDRRFFDGEIYKTLGFSFINFTVPSYSYIKNKKVLNRLHFQKHKLKNILNKFDPSKTEWQNMFNNGYDRIWDCGNSKWIYKKL